MASKPNTRVGNGRGVPLNVSTAQQQQQPQSRRDQRFSWAETPVEMQDPRHASFYNRSRSDDAPVAVPAAEGGQQEQEDGSRTMWPSQAQLQQQETARAISVQQQPQGHPQGTPAPGAVDNRALTASAPQSTSPYGVPEPTEPHPALFAPIVSNGSHYPPQRPGSIPLSDSPAPQQSTTPTPAQQPQPTEPAINPQRNSTQKPLPSEPDPQSFGPPKKTPAQIYSPTSLQNPHSTAFANPNTASHRPGQISHPNMNLAIPGVKAQWYHQLCECSSDMGTCLEGVFCPCMLYSRTSYRLNAKAERRDPTDLLGFERLNSRCLLFAGTVFCGLHCRFCLPLLRCLGLVGLIDDRSSAVLE